MDHRTAGEKAKPTMPRLKRHEWIMSYFNARPALWYENVLNSDFVDIYVEATNVPFMCMMYGANRCPTLGRDLADLYRMGKLKRTTGGVGDARSLGFSTWVWMYSPIREPENQTKP